MQKDWQSGSRRRWAGSDRECGGHIVARVRLRRKHQAGHASGNHLSPFPSKTSWTCGSIVRDDDHRTFTQPSRSSIPHHTVDAGVSGEGGLGAWVQSTGGLVRGLRRLRDRFTARYLLPKKVFA